MDKDNERILLANVIGECIKSLELDKGISRSWRSGREYLCGRCGELKGVR